MLSIERAVGTHAADGLNHLAFTLEHEEGRAQTVARLKEERRAAIALLRIKLDRDAYDSREYGGECLPSGCTEHREAVHRRRKDQRRLNNELRADLETAHGITGHGKAETLWAICWEEGQYVPQDVAYWYAKLIHLVRA